MRVANLFLVLGLISSSAVAQTTSQEKALNELVAKARHDFRAPGVSVVILRDDKIIYLHGEGVRTLGKPTPVTPDTLFAIASCSKAFTATLAASLVAEGKMSWDDNVRKHLSWFHLQDPLANRDITVRDLLCHRTGLPRHDAVRYRAPWGRDEIVRRMAALEPKWPFRTRFEYANLPFVAAGLALENAEKRPLADIVHLRLLKPLGMTRTVMRAEDAQKDGDCSDPHRWTKGDMSERIEVIDRYMQNYDGAGGLNSCARDMGQWLRFQLNEGKLDSQQLLTVAALRETHAPQIPIPRDGVYRALFPEDDFHQVSYGLGWRVADYQGNRLIAHSGGIDGFRSHCCFMPEKRLGLAVLCNLSPTFLPEALSLSLLDCLLDIKGKDWNKHFLAAASERELKDEADKKKKESRRKPGTKPSRDLADYAGIYRSPGYGELTITLEKDALRLTWSYHRLPLRHFHFDTFSVADPRHDFASDVAFQFDGAGALANVVFLEQTFVRVPKSKPQEKQKTTSDTDRRLLEDLRYLTSDECEGRGIRTKGIDRAADYIGRQFALAGLEPGAADGTFFQPFTLTVSTILPGRSQLVLTGPLGQQIALTQGEHFQVIAQGGKGKADAPLVFVGHGITSKFHDHDDYAGQDVRGKIVVLLTDAPLRGHPTADRFGRVERTGASPHSLLEKLRNAQRRGAVGVLLVNNHFRGRWFNDLLPPVRGGVPLLEAPVSLPVLQVRRDTMDALLRSTCQHGLAEIERDRELGRPLPSTALQGWSAQLEAMIEHTPLRLKNVIGYLKGEGPYAGETVVLGAHYDHLGMGNPGAITSTGVSGPTAPGGVGFPAAWLNKSALYPGADDNASGTSAILELARHFGAMKNRQGRRLVFMAFSAEENGLLGSEYYCRHPLLPHDKTAAMINLDMIGRLQDDRLDVRGLGTSKGFPALVERLNARQKPPFQLRLADAGWGSSDFASFFHRQTPVLSFMTGFHEQYHRPGDRLDTLNIEGIARVTALVADLTRVLAEMPRPEYVAERAVFDRLATPWGLAPCVGLVLKTQAQNLVVDQVDPDTPAARAGVKKGDQLLQLGGNKVRDLSDYLMRTRTLKPGQAVTLQWSRDGKTQEGELRLVALPAHASSGLIPDMADDLGGLLVGAVQAGSSAADAGLRPGDRIVAVGTRAIRTNREWTSVLANVPAGKTQEITVLRHGEPLGLTITFQ